MPKLALLALAFAAALADAHAPDGPTAPRTTGELPEVGTVGEDLRVGRYGALSFRTPEHGFLGAPMGAILETHDGGSTWAPVDEGRVPGRSMMEGFQRMHWLGPEVGLAAGFFPSKLIRTSDAGQTWQPAVLPKAEAISAIESIGANVWVCGWKGYLATSVDAGATWTPLPRVFSGDEHCDSLSFVDEKDGWAGGSRGSVWQTLDGGRTWSPLASPLPAPRERTRKLPNGNMLMVPDPNARLFRLDARRAWAAVTWDPMYVTEDGGRTWTASVKPPDHAENLAVREVARPDGPHRYLAVVGSTEYPWLGDHAAVRSGESAMDYDQFELSEWREGRIVRHAKPTGRPPGKERLQGVGRIDRRRQYGWSGPRIYRSDDDGGSWLVEATAPEPIETLAYLTAQDGLARTASGKILSRQQGPKAWGESPNPELDAWFLRRAVGSGPEVPDPLACLATAPNGEVRVEFGVSGCFGGSGESLVLTWSPGAGSAATRDEGWGHRDKDRAPEKTRTMPPDEVRAAVARLATVARESEVAPGIRSTNHTTVTLRWTCDGGPTHEARFNSSACGTFGAKVGAMSEFAGAPGRQRACDLYEAAAALRDGGAAPAGGE